MGEGNLPLGEGTSIDPFYGIMNVIRQMPSQVFVGIGEEFSLSRRERAGVRGKTKHVQTSQKPRYPSAAGFSLVIPSR
jgi:hypothetical protein